MWVRKLLVFSGVFLIFSMMMTLTACRDSKMETSSALQIDSSDQNQPQCIPKPSGIAERSFSVMTYPGGSTQTQLCHETVYQPGDGSTMNMLFLVDASQWMQPDLPELAIKLGAMIREFSVLNDLKVGVLVAHAGATAGELYQSPAGEPLVITEAMGSSNEMVQAFYQKLVHAHTVPSVPEHGRLLKHTLHEALTTKRNQLNLNGFFTPGIDDWETLIVVTNGPDIYETLQYPRSPWAFGIQRTYFPGEVALASSTYRDVYEPDAWNSFLRQNGLLDRSNILIYKEERVEPYGPQTYPWGWDLTNQNFGGPIFGYDHWAFNSLLQTGIIDPLIHVMGAHTGGPPITSFPIRTGLNLSQIQLAYNGVVSTDFTYNSSTGVVTFGNLQSRPRVDIWFDCGHVGGNGGVVPPQQPPVVPEPPVVPYCEDPPVTEPPVVEPPVPTEEIPDFSNELNF